MKKFWIVFTCYKQKLSGCTQYSVRIDTMFQKYLNFARISCYKLVLHKWQWYLSSKASRLSYTRPRLRLCHLSFDLDFASVIFLRTLTSPRFLNRWTLTLHGSIVLKFGGNLYRKHSLFHSESGEHKLIAIIVISSKSIYFLLRNGDPSLIVFLSFCDSSADISDARGLWRCVLRGEMGSK